MKERPILFNADMINAILEGRKTQTRRVVKHQPPDETYRFATHMGGTSLESVKKKGWFHWIKFEDYRVLDSTKPLFQCPYGKVGDRLWVRETWFVEKEFDKLKPSQVPKTEPVGYPASNIILTKHGQSIVINGKNRPSIFMPKWASRITLEITDIRVERLNDISEDDAKAEGMFFTDYGMRCFHNGGVKDYDPDICKAPKEHHNQKAGWSWKKTTSWEQCLGSAKFAFGNLWQSINGKDSWQENPWVWVIEFKRVDG